MTVQCQLCLASTRKGPVGRMNGWLASTLLLVAVKEQVKGMKWLLRVNLFTLLWEETNEMFASRKVFMRGVSWERQLQITRQKKLKNTGHMKELYLRLFVH